MAAKDGSEALVTYVQVLSAPNILSRVIRLKGLEALAEYSLEGTENVYTGEELMNCGFPVPSAIGDFISSRYHFIKK